MNNLPPDYRSNTTVRSELHPLFDRAGEMMPTFSSDGRWIAYVSPQSARNEVYVQSSTGEGITWQISNDGGVGPVWSASARELFYRAADKMMVVDVLQSTTIAFSKPRVLFEGAFVFGDTEGQEFRCCARRAPLPDAEAAVSVAAAPLPVVVNWFADVLRLMAASQ